MRKTNNKTTGKAKRLIMAAALCILSITQAWAYDFSVVVPSGQTLYFIINSNNTVGVTYPNANATDIAYIYNGYTKPTGNLVIPSSVTYNGTTYPVTVIGEYAFADCTGLNSVTIPNSVTFIGYGAFYGCTGLTSVTIPNSVTTIGDGAFYNCTGLNTFTIPSSVQWIGGWAFYGTAYYNNSSNWVNNVLYKDNCLLNANNSLSGSYSIQSNTRVITCWAFSGCTGLTSVNIPNSVTTIGDNAFYYCTGLTSVTIPNSVTTIGGSAFGNCTGLTTVTIPNSVTSIGSYAFGYCTGLTSVNIPNSVTYIGSRAFSECSSLATLNFNAINCSGFSYDNSHPFYGCPISTINIGDSVQYIPAAFAHNKTSLTSITIPNSVTSIGYCAFYGCTGLSSVTIPNSVTSIGSSAFYGCTSIGRIDLKSVTPPTINSNSFQNVSSAIPVYIPCGSLSNYSSSNWGTIFPNLQESQLFSLGVAVNDSTMGMALILSNTCANTAIQAYPYDGYNFVGWSDGSTMNPRVVTLTQDTVFTAIFEANVQRYTITVMSANNNMGTVSGGGTYEEGTEITITATPAENHHFVSWNDGNTDNPRTITVTGDAVYIASFAEDVSIDAANELDALTFYPNPTSGTITFNCTDIRKVEVMDAMGRMMAEYIDSYVIDLSKLSKGHYTMRITTDNGVTIRKVIRN